MNAASSVLAVGSGCRLAVALAVVLAFVLLSESGFKHSSLLAAPVHALHMRGH